jgi:predicted SnoaL-like aldol condensation-catalyzing enzyme
MADPKVERNKELVLQAMTSVFIKRDLSAFEKYWAEDYIQHNCYIPPFRKGLRELAASLPSEVTYEPGMIIGEGDLVMIHGRYSPHGPFNKPAIAVDIFRIANGLLVEHWDVLMEEVPVALTKSGNAMFTNPQKQLTPY